jgi:hypothetical protein
MSRKFKRPTIAAKASPLVLDLFALEQSVTLHCCACHRAKRSTFAKIVARYSVDAKTTVVSLREQMACGSCGARLMTISPVLKPAGRPSPVRGSTVTQVGSQFIWSSGGRSRHVSANQADRAVSAQRTIRRGRAREAEIDFVSLATSFVAED